MMLPLLLLSSCSLDNVWEFPQHKSHGYFTVFQVEPVWWVEGHVGSELHCRAVECLSKASAHSSLSSLVPSFTFLLSLACSQSPLLGGFLISLLGPVTVSHSTWNLFPNPSTTSAANPVS